MITFLFNTLLGCLIFIAMFLAVVIALYMLKIMLTELFDGYGVEEFISWMKECGIGKILPKKK